MEKSFLYKVQKAFLGSDRKEDFYFRTHSEAQEFSQAAYTSVPVKVFVSESVKKKLLEATEDSLYFQENY